MNELIDKIKDFLESLMKFLIKTLVGSEEPPRPNPDDKDTKSLWYPLAKIPATKMKTQGKYKDNYPVGCVVHYTSGRSNVDNSVDYGAKMGYCYFLIAKDGMVYQCFPLDRWGYHCGVSQWPTLGSSLSSKLVGIEVVCAGDLEKTNDKYKTWFNEEIPASNVRIATKEEFGVRGYFEKYTPEQEESLINLILWLKTNNPLIFMLDNVLGHQEISPDRKIDPGGSLSVPMHTFRDILKKKYQEGERIKPRIEFV